LQRVTYFPNAINRVNSNIFDIPLGTTYLSVHPIQGILPYFAQRELKLRFFFVTENGQGFTRQHFVLPYIQSLLSNISSAVYITPTVFCIRLQLKELKPIYLSHTLKCWEDGSVTVTIDAS